MKLYLNRSKCSFGESLNGNYVEVETDSDIAIETKCGDAWLKEDEDGDLSIERDDAMTL